MTNPFANLSTEGLAERKDVVGGFSLPESGIYHSIIKAMYLGQSSTSQARSVTIIFVPENGSEQSVTVWVTNRDGKNHDKNNRMLPGYELIDDICIMVTGKGLNSQAMRTVELELMDWEDRQRKMMAKTIFADIVDKPIYFAVQKSIVDRNKKDGSGNYVATGETREEIQIQKAYHYPTKSTLREAQKKIPEHPHFTEWNEKHSGKTINRAKGANAGAGVKTGRPDASTASKASPEETENLFG